MHEEIGKMFDLTGKVALITGGARNLGFDGACVLAGAGADLVVTSRSQSSAEKAAIELSDKYGVDVLGLPLDQSEFKQVEAMVKKAQAWKGHVDILLNNAGGGSGKSVAYLFDRDPRDIDELIRINLTGVLYCCREVGRVMSERGAGKIINIASIAGMLGRDRKMYDRNGMLGQPIDYAASKGGVIGLTYDLAALLGPQGICVNAISPGGFRRDLPEGFAKDYSERTALGRMGRDGIDLNGAILYLASSASDYVAGHNLVVDGGFSILH